LAAVGFATPVVGASINGRSRIGSHFGGHFTPPMFSGLECYVRRIAVGSAHSITQGSESTGHDVKLEKAGKICWSG
jgi:hypothetical protein